MNVVVTGASSGIGEAVARRYLARGDRVWTLARRAEQLPGKAIQCDVRDAVQVEAAAKQVDGDVDILINNAGTGMAKRFMDASPDDLRRVIETNLLGAMYVTKAFLPKMTAGSTMVHVASVAGKIAPPGSSVYSASKFGFVGFTESLRAELGSQGIRVMLVNPGPIETEGFPQTALMRSWLSFIVASVDDCADAIVAGVEKRRTNVYVPGWFRPLVVLGRATLPITNALLRRVPFRAGGDA